MLTQVYFSCFTYFLLYFYRPSKSEPNEQGNFGVSYTIIKIITKYFGARNLQWNWKSRGGYVILLYLCKHQNRWVISPQSKQSVAINSITGLIFCIFQRFFMYVLLLIPRNCPLHKCYYCSLMTISVFYLRVC